MTALLRIPATVLVGLIFAPANLGAAQDRYPFVVESHPTNGGYRLVAMNSGPAAVSVRLALVESSNLMSDPALPMVAVVPPSGQILLAQLRPAVPGRGHALRFTTSWLLGDLNARPSPDAHYRLPFREGATHRIGQAPDGPITTHTDAQSAFAVDIAMPSGEPILASRDGVVIHTEASQIHGGKSPDLLGKANEIRVRHLDGTIGVYAHMAFGGVHVYPGQRIMAGEQIGLAGSTGYSSGPHLHFAVQTVEVRGDELRLVSHPFQFYVGNPPVRFTPQYGQLATASYSRPMAAPVIPQAPGPSGLGLNETPSRTTVSLAVPEPVMAFFRQLPFWMWIAGTGLALLLVALINYLASYRPRIEAYGAVVALPERDDWRYLLAACGGNVGLANRLIDFEWGVDFSISRSEAITCALRRLRTDLR